MIALSETLRRWGVVRVGRDVHCVPLDEKKLHRKSRRCPCGPHFQDENEDPAWEGDDMPLVVAHAVFAGEP